MFMLSRIGPIVEQGKSLCAQAVDKFVSKRDEAVASSHGTETDQLTNGTS